MTIAVVHLRLVSMSGPLSYQGQLSKPEPPPLEKLSFVLRRCALWALDALVVGLQEACNGTPHLNPQQAGYCAKATLVTKQPDVELYY